MRFVPLCPNDDAVEARNTKNEEVFFIIYNANGQMIDLSVHDYGQSRRKFKNFLRGFSPTD
ncbi:hypothetical protein SBV1_60041 [Verrucomicrobia bacterium]|nr:hypothetical protein SBV1_60041 [Verrucomicrobiota bacterium]